MQPPTTSPSRLRVALFLAIAEHFEAAMHLIHVSMESHAAVHVRAMLEGLVDMSTLGKDAKHVDKKKFKTLKEEIKMYQELLNYPILPVESKLFIQGKLDDCQTVFGTLHATKSRNQNKIEEIAEADLPDLVVPYIMLCGFSHNDLSILAMRHQGDDAMTYMAPVDPLVVALILSIALRIMMAATQPLPDIASFPNGLFDEVLQDMNNAWGRVLPV
jgi:hypothetical protein